MLEIRLQELHRKMLSSKQYLHLLFTLLTRLRQIFPFIIHCVKSVHIRSFSGPYFPAFGLNKDRFSASLRIQFKCEKIRTIKTPNTDTLYAVIITTFDPFCVDFPLQYFPVFCSKYWRILECFQIKGNVRTKWVSWQ